MWVFVFVQTSEKEMLIREMGEERAGVKGQEASEHVIYKIDIPANRHVYDHVYPFFVYSIFTYSMSQKNVSTSTLPYTYLPYPTYPTNYVYYLQITTYPTNYM